MTDPLDYSAVEANDPTVIPAPDIDPTAIVYIPENEVATNYDDYGDDEDADSNLVLLSSIWERVKEIDEKLDKIDQTQQGLKTGVNTIGEMMNGVAQVFDDLMKKVQQGGIGSLLGGFMGGKREDG